MPRPPRPRSPHSAPRSAPRSSSPSGSPRPPAEVLQFPPGNPLGPSHVDVPEVRHQSSKVCNAEDDLGMFTPRPERGKGEVVSFRVDRDALDAVDWLVSHNRGPWQSKTDFARSGFHLLLRIAASQEGADLFTLVHYLESRHDSVRIQMNRARIREHYKAVESNVKMILEDRGRSRARLVLNQEWKNTREMAKGSPGFRKARKRFFAQPWVRELWQPPED